MVTACEIFFVACGGERRSLGWSNRRVTGSPKYLINSICSSGLETAADSRMVHFHKHQPVNSVCGQTHSFVCYKDPAAQNACLESTLAAGCCRVLQVFLMSSFLLLSPMTCMVRGQMSLHTHGTQMAKHFAMLMLEAETANNNNAVFCTR